jgi:hypothetical protein
MRRFRITPFRLVVAVFVGSLACTGVAYAASLGLGSNKLFAWSQTLTKGTCNQTYTTEDDTYVDQNSPASNFGSATTLGITALASKQQYALIRFDLSGCSLPTTAGADSATLTVFVSTATTHTISVYPVTSSWSGSTLTWNTVGGLTVGSTATTSFTGSAGSHTVTITTAVDTAIKAGALWGWELRDTTAGPGMTTKLASEENATVANRPSMTLSYEK